MTVYNAWYQRKMDVFESRERMEKILAFAVLYEEEVIREVQRDLAMLADVPVVRGGGKPASEILARLLKNSPKYTNFLVCRPDGRVISSALPLRSAVDFSDRPYFQEVLKNKSFTIGQYFVGRITGKPVIPFAWPVLDRRGEVTAVLIIPLDLSLVTEFEAEIDTQIPPSSSYIRLDSRGSVMSAFPDAQMFGKGHPLEEFLFRRISKEKKGTFQMVGADGVDRLYLFSPYHSPMKMEGGYALLGIPTRSLFAAVDRQLAISLAILSIVASLFLSIMWWGGNTLLARPVRILADASKRLEAGDLAARSGLGSTPGEFGQLGGAFDEMAAELQRRQDESLRMQEALRASAEKAEKEKAKTEAIIAGMGDGISIQDRNYRILFQNQVLKDDAGDHVGEVCYRAYHGLDRVCDGCAAERSFRDGKIHTKENIAEVNGKTRYFENTVSPMRDSSGNITGAIEVVRDITGRKKSEHRIRKGIKILSDLREIDRHILRGADVRETFGVVCDAVVGMGYRHCWVGLAEPDHTVRPVAARGVELEELANAGIRWDDSPRGQGPSGAVIKSGKPLVSRDIFGDEGYEPWRNAAVNLGCPARASYPLKTGDGHVWGVFHAYGGDPDCFSPEELQDLETFAGQVSVAMESSRQWEAIRDAHQRLTFHVNRMPLGFIVWNKDFRVTEWNPAAERIFGWKAEEAIGKSPYEFLIPSSETEHIGEIWSKLLQGGEDGCSLNDNMRIDGKTITCEWFNAPLRDARGNVNGVLSMVHDVTERALLERQVQTAQRMEAVGTLAGGIAHDFNNALTGIFGFAEMLRVRNEGNEKALSDIDEILRCANRAATLTRQLLTYSRRQIISPINLSLNGVVADLMKLVSKVVGEHIEIRTFLAEGLPTVRADAGQMEQVVMNLVLNARDAMPGGGQLLIETGVAELDEEFVRLHPFMRIGRYVVLSVSDTGCGMDSTTRERVFEPFFTTKAPDKGTGLGLAVVYGIVKQHNGFIHLYSEPGKGTTFKIYIPPVDAAPDALLAEETDEVSGGTETILLAEDDESVRRFSERTLKELGYTVLDAGSGGEALAIFDRHKERVDLVLLDVVMPARGG
ncbi:MAG: PAS domain S-box protein, partial [Thermodesulfobacteriota bacterium]